MQLSEQEIVRREKLSKLRELGINPYPADLYPVDNLSKQIKDDFEEGKKVIIAGRLMRKKVQGKASFAEIFALSKFGIAIAAKSAIIATTIIISTNVKPF